MSITDARLKQKSCPENVVPYDGHYLIGKSQEQLLGWDYRTFAFDVNTEDVVVFFSDNTTSMQSTIGAGNLNDLGTKIVTDFYISTFVASTGNPTIITYTVDGGFLYFTVVGPLANNLQMTIRNNATGVWADGSANPDGDALDGRPPSLFSITGNGECEVIEVNNGTYDCSVDEVLVKKNGVSYTGSVYGWSLPENAGWHPSNTIFSNTSVYDLTLNVETNGLPAQSFSYTGITASTFQQLLSTFNADLATYGSGFRLAGFTDNRVLFTQTDGTTLVAGSTDPYFVANNFVNLVIDIFDTTADFLVKGTLATDFVVSNLLASGANGLVWATMPCATTASLPQLTWEKVTAQYLGNPLHTGVEATSVGAVGIPSVTGNAEYAVPQIPVLDQALIDSGNLYVQYGYQGYERVSKVMVAGTPVAKRKGGRVRWYNPYPNPFASGTGFLGGTPGMLLINNPGLVRPNLIPVTVQRQKITEPVPYWTFYAVRPIFNLKADDLALGKVNVDQVAFMGGKQRKMANPANYLPTGGYYGKTPMYLGWKDRKMVNSTWYCRLVLIENGRLVATGPMSEPLFVKTSYIGGASDQAMAMIGDISGDGVINYNRGYLFKGWTVAIADHRNS